MRHAGTAPHPSAGPHQHICWGFEDVADFRREARAFIEDGLAHGLRVQYASPGDLTELREHLDGIDGVDGHLADGALELVSLDGFYTGGSADGVDPEGQVAAYAAATERALADGYAGLRAAADATDCVRTPAQRAAFCRYEHLVDAYMAANPMTAMCGYALQELGAEAVAELACVHPVSSQDAAPFHLFTAGDHLTLTGEVDLCGEELFAGALAHAIGPADEPHLVIDVGTAFMDHRAMLALDARAREQDREVVLVTPDATTAKLADVLDLAAVSVRAR